MGLSGSHQGYTQKPTWETKWVVQKRRRNDNDCTKVRVEYRTSTCGVNKQPAKSAVELPMDSEKGQYERWEIVTRVKSR